jgi:hypothetical protein
MSQWAPAVEDEVARGAQPGARSPTRLQGRRLQLARLVYAALLVFLLALFVARLPAQVRSLLLTGVGVRFTNDWMGETGLQVGDSVLRINGIPIRPWTWLTDIDRLRSDLGGARIILDVRGRDGETRAYRVAGDMRGLLEAGLSLDGYALYLTALDALLLLGFCVPALIIFSRKSDDWLALAISLILVMFAVLAANSLPEIPISASLLPLGRAVSGFIGLLYKVSSVLFFYVFPDGRFVPRWTRKLVPVAVVWGLLWQLPAPANPWGWPYFLGNILDVGLVATGLYAQAYRYRRVSGPQERQQTKWVLFGLAVGVVCLYAYRVPMGKLPLLQEPTAARFRFQVVGQTISYLGLLAIPLTLTLSILRYRLYDIDLILNRTLVYVPLTAILAGIAAACISLSQKLFASLTDQQSVAASVLTTLFVVAAMTPIRDRLQKLVDRHFKEIPDPARQLGSFATQLQARLFPVDPHEVTRSLLQEAVIAFGATGGAIALDGDSGHATRGWNGQAHLRVPLRSGEARLGLLSLGARRDGADYTDRDRRLLQEAARAAARAIEQDRVALPRNQDE